MKNFIYLALSFAVVACSDKKQPTEKHRFSEKDLAYFEAIKANDEALSEPLYGQWRYHHHEQKQSLDDYISEHPFIPNSKQSVIYLQPLGEFTSLQMKAIGLTRDYLEIFFQRKTVVLPPISDAYIPPNARRENSGHEQLLTGHILKKNVASRRSRRCDGAHGDFGKRPVSRRELELRFRSGFV